MNWDKVIEDTTQAIHQTQIRPEDWEANTPDGLIPDSWVDDTGIRHAVIWDVGGDTNYMRIELRDGSWEIIDELPF